MNPQPGDRIELTAPMQNDPCPIEVGAQGIVNYFNDLGDFTQIGVKWDNGRTLMLCCPPDEFRILPKPE
jgi:hypothetical protein